MAEFDCFNRFLRSTLRAMAKKLEMTLCKVFGARSDSLDNWVKYRMYLFFSMFFVQIHCYLRKKK